MDEKIVAAKADAAAAACGDGATLASLEARLASLERREADRRARTIVICSVLAVIILVCALVAAPRVNAALRTLDQVSALTMRYSAQLKELDPNKLQETIQFINGLDLEAIDDAGDMLAEVDLDALMQQLSALESATGEQSELRRAVYAIGLAIAAQVEGFNDAA